MLSGSRLLLVLILFEFMHILKDKVQPLVHINPKCSKTLLNTDTLK
jgi:hypothetical protein